MSTAIHQKIAQAEAGQLSTAIAKLASGWLVAGDVQPLRGYCVLLSHPVAVDFNALDEARRAQYALDMGRVGDGLLAALGAYRINYETWGNLDPALHTHIVPRYRDEPDELRVLPPRQAYDWVRAKAFDPAIDTAWIEALRAYLGRPA